MLFELLILTLIAHAPGQTTSTRTQCLFEELDLDPPKPPLTPAEIRAEQMFRVAEHREDAFDVQSLAAALKKDPQRILTVTGVSNAHTANQYPADTQPGFAEALIPERKAERPMAYALVGGEATFRVTNAQGEVTERRVVVPANSNLAYVFVVAKGDIYAIRAETDIALHTVSDREPNISP